MFISLVGPTTPIRRPVSSTTGKAATPWCKAIDAIFSWSVPGSTQTRSRRATRPSSVVSGSASNSAGVSVPSKRSLLSITHTSSQVVFCASRIRESTAWAVSLASASTA
ncbi:hypothetical protein FQZ97_1065420 [compost metagenome]